MTAPTRADLADIRVLVVDDNAFLRGLYADMLLQSGVKQVSVAADGRQAIEDIPYQRPDVVFLDWWMPGMSGLELIKWIRQSPTSPCQDVGVILVTTASSPDVIRQARDAGVSEFLVKPVSFGAIISRLGAVVNNPRKFVRSHSYVGPCRRRYNDPAYAGDQRRLDDPIVIDADQSAWDAVSHRLKSEVRILRAMLDKFDFSDRAVLRMFREHIRKLTDFAVRQEDDAVAQSAESLIEYVNAVGASNSPLQIDVVDVHLTTLEELSSIIPEHPARQSVVKGLRQVVDKRLGRSVVG